MSNYKTNTNTVAYSRYSISHAGVSRYGNNIALDGDNVRNKTDGSYHTGYTITQDSYCLDMDWPNIHIVPKDGQILSSSDASEIYIRDILLISQNVGTTRTLHYIKGSPENEIRLGGMDLYTASITITAFITESTTVEFVS